MTNSPNKPIRLFLVGSFIGVNVLIKVAFERFQLNQPLQVVESLVLNEAQIIENVSTICDHPADWVFLMHYFHLHTVDRVAELIKQTHPQTKVAALSVVMQEKEPAEPQYLDYLHYYPISPQHIKDAVEHLLNI